MHTSISIQKPALKSRHRHKKIDSKTCKAHAAPDAVVSNPLDVQDPQNKLQKSEQAKMPGSLLRE